jgi:hypothetical protein
MSVVKRGEKEQKLVAFLDRHFARGYDHHHDAGHDILLIARSIRSPVVQAVASLAPRIAAAERSLRMIVAHADREALPPGWSISDATQIDCEMRWARNRRLLEAHEQLVLGRDTCWTGDSMRRDPAKCDAYETFVEGDPVMTGAAYLSFERLWSASEPLLPRPPLPRRSVGPAATARGR